MKHFKVAILALLLVIGFNKANAQDEVNPWAIGFGATAIDFYPTNPHTDWGGKWLDEFVNADDHWNAVPAISRLTVGRHLASGFIFEANGSFSQIKKMGDMEVDKLAYWNVDGVVKWSINSVANTGIWDPYLLVGGGYTWLDDMDTAALNAGAGMNFWFGKESQVGLNLEVKLRETFESQLKSHFQWSGGLIFKMGGKDTDGDGIYDKLDACPDVFGLAEFNGCPDSDSDGIVDADDACPNTAGLAEFNGCPDSDGDGITDKDDACPNAKGTKANNGCPDTDGDGVVDKDDKCVDKAGPAANNGCPWPDTDGDGVVDKDDKCVDKAGPASNDGCPLVTEEVLETLKELARTVYFDTGKSTFKSETIGRLDLVVGILSKYPNQKFHIEGHTDSSGSDALNLRLSKERAAAVKDYLVSKGISSSILTSEGYGEANPIETNKTRAGRAINRRVEIKLVK